MDNRWLSLAEIADYLGVSKDSVYRWVEERDMPAHKVGRQWKFKVHEVDSWVRNGEAGINAPEPKRPNAKARSRYRP